MEIEDVAWEFVGIFDDLTTQQINEMLAKNVPMEMLKFFSGYADEFGTKANLSLQDTMQLPNLMLIGYLMRVLEERLLLDESPG